MGENEELRVQSDEQGEPRRRAKTALHRTAVIVYGGISRGKNKGEITAEMSRAIDIDETKRILTWWTFSNHEGTSLKEERRSLAGRVWKCSQILSGLLGAIVDKSMRLPSFGVQIDGDF